MRDKSFASVVPCIQYQSCKRSNKFIRRVILGLIPLITTSCQMDDKTDVYERKVENEKVIQEQLDNTHARIAAKRNDVCPKLVGTEVDTHHIIRENEHLLSGYCDYYIYPDVGQHIMVTTNNDDLETYLITPYIHNFANGDITVNARDKYVIRVMYDGIMKQPRSLKYDLDIAVN